MRVPNVPERVKEAPAHALRAVFAGVGQALLLTDRVRRRFHDGEQEQSAPGQSVTAPRAPVTPPAPAVARPPAPPSQPTPSPAPGPVPAAAPSPAAAPPAAPSPAAAPTAAPSPAASKPAAAPPAASKPAAAPPAASKPAAAPGTASKTAAAGKPPLPNYDDLTIASLRARMRGLGVSQLRDLITYEKAHAARADVIAMFERRISKLQSTAG